MTERTRVALKTLLGGVLLGIAGDVLLRPVPWGLNAALWLTGLVGVSLRAGETEDRNRRMLPWLSAILPFALFLMWRDSVILKALDLLAIGVLLSLAARRGRDEAVQPAYLKDYVSAGSTTVTHVAKGTLQVLSEDMAWDSIPRQEWRRHAQSALIGLILAFPLLVIFGALFFSADAVFERYVSDFAAHGLRRAASHVALAVIIAWIATGLLRNLILSARPEGTAGDTPDAGLYPADTERPSVVRSIGMVEIAVMLTLINGLFAAFVAVQLRYLFGGADRVRTVAGLTYAEYARRGFFELVTVAALVLPLLLASHLALKDTPIAHRRPFRILAWGLIALLAVIMASAMQRLALYQRAYGLTELRLYAAAFMVWLAIVLAWFGATVLRERRERFAFGAIAAGLTVVVLLHVANPDSLIVQTNVSRDGTRAVDSRYLATLSADAVPALLKASKEHPDRLDSDVMQMLTQSWRARLSSTDDWRSWSWARHRASVALEQLAETVGQSGPGEGGPG